jgi:hypothetical protein
MNERIKELAEQCWINDGGPDSYFSQQKFAELIVRECIEWCDAHATINGSAQQIRNSIKEHFGVES